jgi:hypothetical protein
MMPVAKIFRIAETALTPNPLSQWERGLVGL